MEYKIIEDKSELEKLIKDIYINKISEVAVDLEGESNLHRYGFHLCLIQLKVRENCFLIDPVKIDDLTSIKDLFEDKSISKVMYAAEFDIKLLKHTKGIDLRGLFDLQPAAKYLGLEKLSLKNALEHFLNISVPKSKKKQQANWNKRPIRRSLLEYAASDVYHLLALKEHMLPELHKLNHISELKKQNKLIENSRFAESKNPHLSIKRAFKLNRKATVYLKHFYELREHIAKEKDVPVYMIMRNNDLANLAKFPPSKEDKWFKIKGLTELAKDKINDFKLYKEAADRDLDRL